MLYKIGCPILSLHIIDIRRKTARLNKFSAKVVADLDTDKYVFHDVEILHSVLLEKNSDFLIRRDTEENINANFDAWDSKELLSSYKTFLKNKETGEPADVFVEHVQVKELSKGKVFDAVPIIDKKGIVTIHLLIGTEKKHKDLISMIESGIYNAVSMGCTVDYVRCTICGAKTEDEYACEHLAYHKGERLIGVDGKLRVCAELCFGSNFYDCSWVRFPADSKALVSERIA